MKRLALLAGAMVFATSIFAQEKVTLGAYELTPIAENKATSVKDQNRSSTCWCFCTIGMIESDIIKMGKGTYDLSEMWIVRNNYYDKIVRYVRMHGKQNLSGGGAQADVVNTAGKYGLVPESVYTGNAYGADGHVHGELDRILYNFANSVIKNSNKGLSTAWKNALNGILDAYFGVRPETFTYEGKEYTPKSFAAAIGFNADDYIYMTSFSHHPYNTFFALEVPDNWNNSLLYNVPFELYQEMMQEVIKNGYSISWAADLSKGFKHNKGLALYPDVDVKSMDNSERARWGQMSNEEKKDIYNYETVVKEKIVTAEEHQNMFDTYDTTDDHGMLLTSLYKDQNGTIYFKTKNSWNVDNSAAKGWLYTSAPYIRAKTTSIMFNKKALDKNMLKALKLKK